MKTLSLIFMGRKVKFLLFDSFSSSKFTTHFENKEVPFFLYSSLDDVFASYHNGTTFYHHNPTPPPPSFLAVPPPTSTPPFPLGMSPHSPLMTTIFPPLPMPMAPSIPMGPPPISVGIPSLLRLCLRRTSALLLEDSQLEKHLHRLPQSLTRQLLWRLHRHPRFRVGTWASLLEGATEVILPPHQEWPQPSVRKTLTKLSLTLLDFSHYWKVSPSTVIDIACQSRHLTDVNLSGCSLVTNEAIEVLAKCPLRRLILRRCNKLTDKSLKDLGNCGTLQEIDLLGIPKLTDSGFRALVNKTNLISANFSWTSISDSGMKGLLHKCRFQELRLDWYTFLFR